MKADRATVPTEAVQRNVRKLIADRGEAAARDQLGVGRHTLPRLASGLPVKAVTLAVAKIRLGLARSATQVLARGYSL
jgi:hypothetical protein